MAAYTKSTPGKPTNGQYFPGDTVTDSYGKVYECVNGGIPGEFVLQAGGESALIERRVMSGQASEVFSNLFVNNPDYTRFKIVLERLIINQSFFSMFTLDAADAAQSYTSKETGYSQTGTTLAGFNANLTTSWPLMRSVSNHATSQAISGEILIIKPQLADSVHYWWCGFPGTNAGEPVWRYSQAAVFAGSPSWAGISFVCSAQNFSSGAIAVYGS